MRKVVVVAVREFVATVATKGFVIGVLVTPALIGAMILLMPRLLDEEAPRVKGRVALWDPTGTVAPGVAERLAPEAMAERRAERLARLEAATPAALSALGGPSSQAMEAALGEVPRLDVVALAAEEELAGAKERLTREASGEEPARQLAVIAVHRDAVESARGGELGAYDLWIREKLDDRIQEELREAVRHALIDARLAAAGLDARRVERLVGVPSVAAVTVTAGGERRVGELFGALLPAGFMILLLVSVISGGQHLMTTTIEEKSSRVVEVLLSAVSPMELMGGKILGQLAVGFTVLALYAALGLSALVSFAFLGLVEPILVVFLVLFFVVGYLTVGSLMAAVGAAVTELREAQALMAPIMVVIMIPWILWLPISRDPNSLFAVVTSFLPPLNGFVMLLRLTSTSPPPLWQAWLSVAVGALGGWAAIWLAAKVFRVGLLMHGKPPSFRTLVRWVRMA